MRRSLHFALSCRSKKFLAVSQGSAVYGQQRTAERSPRSTVHTSSSFVSGLLLQAMLLFLIRVEGVALAAGLAAGGATDIVHLSKWLLLLLLLLFHVHL